jgi:polyisoprenoid-binding protein YceI
MSVTTADLTQLTGTYNLDVAHTRIGFVARHAMVTKVRGAFNEFEGTAVIDGTDPAKSHVSVTIKAASIDTRNADRDAHLRSNDFFAMDEFPKITFVSTSVEPVDDTNYNVTGDLTIKGVTKPITVPFEFTGSVVDPWGNHRIGFEGAATARTGASTSTPRSKRAACWSARRSPWSSRSRPSRPPDPNPPRRSV